MWWLYGKVYESNEVEWIETLTLCLCLACGDRAAYCNDKAAGYRLLQSRVMEWNYKSRLLVPASGSSSEVGTEV